MPITQLVVVAMTVGEFCFAGFLWLGHGDWFALYLASLYLLRERYSSLHGVAQIVEHVTHRYLSRP